MIEEFCVPQWVFLLLRMSRRQLRLQTTRGLPAERSSPMDMDLASELTGFGSIPPSTDLARSSAQKVDNSLLAPYGQDAMAIPPLESQRPVDSISNAAQEVAVPDAGQDSPLAMVRASSDESDTVATAPAAPNGESTVLDHSSRTENELPVSPASPAPPAPEEPRPSASGAPQGEASQTLESGLRKAEQPVPVASDVDSARRRSLTVVAPLESSPVDPSSPPVAMRDDAPGLISPVANQSDALALAVERAPDEIRQSVEPMAALVAESQNSPQADKGDMEAVLHASSVQEAECEQRPVSAMAALAPALDTPPAPLAERDHTDQLAPDDKSRLQAETQSPGEPQDSAAPALRADPEQAAEPQEQAESQPQVKPQEQVESQPQAESPIVQPGTVGSTTPVAVEEKRQPPPSPVLAPAVAAQYNRTSLNFHRPMPRPKVNGIVIDAHCHLLAAHHAKDWFAAADHYGIDAFITMSPLEEAVSLQRQWGHRLQFTAVPRWGDSSARWPDEWLTRIEGFYNLGSRIAKFHASPGTMLMRGHRLDEPIYRPLLREVAARKMVIMTHIGDPDTWYNGKYTDTAKYGTREEHYRMWESLLEEYRGTPWLGAHMGGNPENLSRLQGLLDRFPDLVLDCSATRWMQREISARRDAAREFFIRNQDRILFGSDQVSFDDRGYDFLSSRFWVHRKLWETAYIGPSPIVDPDVSEDQQPTLQGLALPDEVLQKLYHDNALALLAKVGASFGGWG